ncbi:MAG: hypothetical protein ACK5LY_05265 [Lachnospirales bacterium]
MFKFYTAIGQLHLVRDENGDKQPIIKWDNKVFELNKNELIIWTSLMWHISDYDELFEVFKSKVSSKCLEVDINFLKMDFNRTLNRLINRNIVVMSEDKVDIISVYNLISDLIIIPSTANWFLSAVTFLKFILVDNIPFSKAKYIFARGNISKNEKSILSTIRKNKFKTSEILSIINIKNNKENLSYDNEERIADLHIGIQTICSLYLKKLIQFE